jgi:chitodextrinase
MKAVLRSIVARMILSTIDPQTPTILHAGTPDGVFSLQQENRPPVADAGADEVVDAGDPVVLDGARSSDPDRDQLAYAWSWPTGAATGVRATVRLPRGTTTVTLMVSDSQGLSATDTVQVTVRAPTPANRPGPPPWSESWSR